MSTPKPKKRDKPKLSFMWVVPVKPKKADVEAVARLMELEGDYRISAWDLCHTADTEGDRLEQSDALIDAAIRLLIRRRDKVIRAFRAAERAWQSGTLDDCSVLHEKAVNALHQYDDERRGRIKEGGGR